MNLLKRFGTTTISGHFNQKLKIVYRNAFGLLGVAVFFLKEVEILFLNFKTHYRRHNLFYNEAMDIDINKLPERVLFEDNHLLVVNKLPSEIVQGDKSGDMPLVEALKLYLGHKYQKPGLVFLGVVHRIDRPTSGVVIFARTSKALVRLNAMLKARDISKKYWAVVKNKPPEQEGKLEHYLRKNEKQNKSYVVDPNAPGAKKAEMLYKVLSHSENYTLIEIELLTGRHHQIRAQLAHIGYPIKGDLKYGFDRSNPDGSINLHARQVSLLHPVKKDLLSLVAPVPDEKLWKLFEARISN